MSGGHWDYQDALEENYSIEDLPKIIEAVIKVFHAIDWAESGDTLREDAEHEIYDIMHKLGDKLFGDYMHGDD